MAEKFKRKMKPGMSRRRFLQLGIVTTAISLGAGITVWRMTSSPVVPATPTTLPASNTSIFSAGCAHRWAPNSTRINEVSSALLHDTLLADGLNPDRVEVYDRAMEYEICVDADGNEISSELLYRHNEGAIVVFTVEQSAMNEDTHLPLIEDVLETLSNFDSFYLQDVEVQLTHAEDSLAWKASFGQALVAEDNLYSIGQP